MEVSNHLQNFDDVRAYAQPLWLKNYPAIPRFANLPATASYCRRSPLVLLGLGNFTTLLVLVIILPLLGVGCPLGIIQ